MWPPDYESDLQLTQAIEYMPERMQQVAWFAVQYARKYHIPEVITDLHTSIDYGPRDYSKVHTLVSSARPFLTGRMRELTGPSVAPCPRTTHVMFVDGGFQTVFVCECWSPYNAHC